MSTMMMSMMMKMIMMKMMVSNRMMMKFRRLRNMFIIFINLFLILKELKNKKNLHQNRITMIKMMMTMTMMMLKSHHMHIISSLISAFSFTFAHSHYECAIMCTASFARVPHVSRALCSSFLKLSVASSSLAPTRRCS